jgi:hypothetical protein
MMLGTAKHTGEAVTLGSKGGAYDWAHYSPADLHVAQPSMPGTGRRQVSFRPGVCVWDRRGQLQLNFSTFWR